MKINSKGKVKQEFIYKVIVLGDFDVGRRELLTLFTKGQKDEMVVASIFKTSIELKKYDVIVNLMFWDHSQFYTVDRSYFNGTDGIVLIFDITRSKTFQSIYNWYNLVVEYELREVPKILIGNKGHLRNERRIIPPMAEHLCEQLDIYYYYETSHLTEYNVKEAFGKIAEIIYESKILNKHAHTIATKPYSGKFIDSPEKIPPFESMKNVFKYKPSPYGESNWPSPFGGEAVGPPLPWSFPTENLACPKCGSVWIRRDNFNSYICLECGYKFYPKSVFPDYL